MSIGSAPTRISHAYSPNGGNCTYVYTWLQTKGINVHWIENENE